MMARLCIRIEPNDHPTDASLNSQRTQPGDVVSMVDDGHVFTPAEQRLYRIIDLPGVPQEDLEHLVQPKVEAVLGGMGPEEVQLARRKFRIDLDALPAQQRTATKANIAAVTRER